MLWSLFWWNLWSFLSSSRQKSPIWWRQNISIWLKGKRNLLVICSLCPNFQDPFLTHSSPTWSPIFEVKKMLFMKGYRKVWMKTNWLKLRFLTLRLYFFMGSKMPSDVLLLTPVEASCSKFWRSSREFLRFTVKNVSKKQKEATNLNSISVGSSIQANTAKTSLTEFEKSLNKLSIRPFQSISIFLRKKKFSQSNKFV